MPINVLRYTTRLALTKNIPNLENFSLYDSSIIKQKNKFY